MADVTLLNFLKIMIFLKIRLDLLSLLFFRALVSERVYVGGKVEWVMTSVPVEGICFDLPLNQRGQLSNWNQ